MDIQKYLNQKKELYNQFLSFIENTSDSPDIYNALIENIKSQNFQGNQEEMTHFLRIISNIGDNHQRTPNLWSKIEQTILDMKDEIKQTMSNSDIFDIFENNKKILLFLFTKDIVTIDEIIFNKIKNKIEFNGMKYCHFFFPEIKKFIEKEEVERIEKEILELDPTYPEKFDEKRQIGENDSILCSLIRSDSIEEFVSFVNRSNMELTRQIKPSIYETNLLLNGKIPTLIEYAAFYGSIQIFKYIFNNEIELEPSLWFYSIHSQNAELISFLEENHILPDDQSFNECLIESIKCHHNDIVQYIEDNFVKEKNEDKVIESSFEYNNYAYFPDDFDNDNVFFYLCQYNYNSIVDFLSKKEEENHDKIDAELLKECKELKKIALPSTIKSIGYLTFQEFTELTHISIPTSVTSIGDYSFYECPSLEKIIIPSTVTSIGYNAFSECHLLKKITIPSSMTVIKSFTFNGCKSLKQVSIPPFIKIIDTFTFNNCSSLEQISIPSSVTEICQNAFRDCRALKHVSIPFNVKKIEEYAFSRCALLKKIIIPNSVRTIGKGAFSECYALKKIIIPNSVTKISDMAFQNCRSLKKITIPDSVESIGKFALDGCTSLEQLTMPRSLNLKDISSDVVINYTS